MDTIDSSVSIVLTAGLCGLRQGELFALRRRDIDLDACVIAVERTRLRLASGEVVEGPPKSAAGTRRVALPAVLTEDLRRHLEEYVEDAPDAFVFTGRGGVPLERSNFRGRVWVRATRAVGLEGLRFHDLRHAAGTLAAHAGATTKELMARLGHGSPRAAMIYQHATEDRDRRIAEQLDAMVRRQQPRRDHGIEL